MGPSGFILIIISVISLSLSLSLSVQKCFTELLFTASIIETILEGCLGLMDSVLTDKEAGSHRVQLLREILGEEVAVEE